jgi:CelD/BcsL family acetyltransferase involved in cellulose biosynthesis
VSRFSGHTAFEEVLLDWQELRGNARYFFQTPEWISALYRQTRDDAVFVSLLDDHRPVSVSFLRRSQLKRFGITLELLSAPGFLTDFRLFADGLLDENSVNRISIDEIMTHIGTWHVLLLERLRINSPWLTINDGVGFVEDEASQGVGVLDTVRSADVYWRDMPKNMRQSVVKARRKAERFAGGELITTSGGNILDEFEQYVLLEDSQEKGRRGTSLLKKEEHLYLIRDYLLASDSAEVRRLEINGRTAACQLTTRVGSTLFLLKIAYDEQLANLSPGNILMADLIEQSCEDPTIDRIDCTVWQPWHERWGMLREPTFRLTAFNSMAVRGRLARAAWNVKRHFNH